MKLSRLSSVVLLGVLAGAMFVTPQTATSQPILQDNVPGSFLVFPKFDIRGDKVTQIRIVNNAPEKIDVKLNYVCPGVKHVNEFCAALDTRIEFTPYQTRIIDVADQNPPCNQGFVVAYAIAAKPADPQPVSWNYLTGSYHIFQGRRHEADTAIAIQSPQAPNAPLGVGGKLAFGGADYVALPSNLYTDFRAVYEDPCCSEGSRLTLLTLDVLAGMQNPPAVAFVDFWNSAEVPFSSSVEFICWTELQLDDIDLNFREENLGTTYGAMRITPVPNCPIPGACPPLVPYDATMLGQLDEYADGTAATRTLLHDTKPKSTSYQPR